MLCPPSVVSVYFALFSFWSDKNVKARKRANRREGEKEIYSSVLKLNKTNEIYLQRYIVRKKSEENEKCQFIKQTKKL